MINSFYYSHTVLQLSNFHSRWYCSVEEIFVVFVFVADQWWTCSIKLCTWLLISILGQYYRNECLLLLCPWCNSCDIDRSTEFLTLFALLLSQPRFLLVSGSSVQLLLSLLGQQLSMLAC